MGFLSLLIRLKTLTEVILLRLVASLDFTLKSFVLGEAARLLGVGKWSAGLRGGRHLVSGCAPAQSCVEVTLS